MNSASPPIRHNHRRRCAGLVLQTLRITVRHV